MRKGKLALAIPIDRWLLIALRPALVQVIPIDTDIARGANEMPGDFPGDPADRLIVATARKFGLTILTSDTRIREYNAVKSIW